MSEAFLDLGSRSAHNGGLAVPKPKMLILGGDHSVSLPALRALRQIYGQPIAVLHFDAHLDTLHPDTYPSSWGSTPFNHGSVFWCAVEEGLILNGSSVHAGLRTRLSGNRWDDYSRDDQQGFLRLSNDLLDKIGVEGLLDGIYERIGKEAPTYLSIDIDVLDPAFAPGTGAPEAGGWTTREFIQILRGLEDLNIVGADIVEVAPAYDSEGEITALAAAQFGYEILTLFVKRGLELVSMMNKGVVAGHDDKSCVKEQGFGNWPLFKLL